MKGQDFQVSTIQWVSPIMTVCQLSSWDFKEIVEFVSQSQLKFWCTENKGIFVRDINVLQ